MKISILVPVYGVEPYIERCAVSLFEQTYENIEYVFVNDCTKDKSIEILQDVIKRYPSRQSQTLIINHEINRGLAAARNTGVDNCIGDYLMHVDSDDYISKDCIQTLVDSLGKNGKPDILFFGSCTEWDNHKINSGSRYKGDKDALLKRMLIYGKSASIWGILYRTDFYKMSGVRSIEGLNYSEDKVVVPRLVAKAKTMSGIDNPLYFYQMSNEQSYTTMIKPVYLENAWLTDDILTKFFTSEFCFLDEKLEALMKLNTKLNFIKMISKSASSDLYSQLQTVYREFDDYSSLLHKTDKIILYLFNKRQYSILNTMFKIGRYFKYRRN